jgi:thiamine biosynthesis lipoprotein
LRDEAMSVSAVWGKSFQSEGKVLGHVIDPRSGEPAEGAWLAAVVLPSATETDALSTALLALGLVGHNRIAGLRAGIRILVLGRANDETPYRVIVKGIELQQTPPEAGSAPVTLEKEN